MPQPSYMCATCGKQEGLIEQLRNELLDAKENLKQAAERGKAFEDSLKATQEDLFLLRAQLRPCRGKLANQKREIRNLSRAHQMLLLKNHNDNLIFEKMMDTQRRVAETWKKEARRLNPGESEIRQMMRIFQHIDEEGKLGQPG